MLQRSAGILIPLFSLRTADDFGRGEIMQMKPMIDFAISLGHRVIQLLPLDETAPSEASPYAALTLFGIDPLYISAVDVAGIGKMPYLGTLDFADGSAAGDGAPSRQQNSAQRLCAIWGTVTVPDAVRNGIAGAGGPVLLVDDRVDSGWSLTVAAMLLREAGATGVLPLTLAATSG